MFTPWRQPFKGFRMPGTGLMAMWPPWLAVTAITWLENSRSLLAFSLSASHCVGSTVLLALLHAYMRPLGAKARPPRGCIFACALDANRLKVSFSFTYSITVFNSICVNCLILVFAVCMYFAMFCKQTYNKGLAEHYVLSNKMVHHMYFALQLWLKSSDEEKITTVTNQKVI